MVTWQVVLATLFLLIPFALMLEFWPRRERLTSSGRPLQRDWRPPVAEREPDEHH